MAQVYLSLGSNVGNRRRFIHMAIDSIGKICKILKISAIYETEPWGKTDQPKFLNLCLLADADLSADELLSRIKQIEKDLGRTQNEKWAEREIDLDILFFDDLIFKKANLTLPHPKIEERAFVLAPLAEIAPDFIHPKLKISINRLAKRIGIEGVNKQASIMGILNLTPDSFSDGGELKSTQTLKQKIQEMIGAGVDIIDIGGESTRPDHKKVEAYEEISRVLPAIHAVREISTDIPISIDTQKSEVARKALEAGANIVNDISAMSDLKMPKIIKDYDCQVILMRNKPLVSNDIIGSCKKQFEEIIEKCEHAGIRRNKVILDPGLGFGDLKTGDFAALPGSDPSTNTELVLSLKNYGAGLPVLIGASRKRFLGKISGQNDPKKRLAESLAFAVLAQHSGASIIRVHDVKETIEALREI